MMRDAVTFESLVIGFLSEEALNFRHPPRNRSAVVNDTTRTREHGIAPPRQVVGSGESLPFRRSKSRNPNWKTGFTRGTQTVGHETNLLHVEEDGFQLTLQMNVKRPGARLSALRLRHQSNASFPRHRCENGVFLI